MNRNPATYHADGAGMSFADGHAALRRWRDTGPLKKPGTAAAPAPNSTDAIWIMQNGSVPNNGTDWLPPYPP